MWDDLGWVHCTQCQELCSNHTNPEQHAVHLGWPWFPFLRHWPRSCRRRTRWFGVYHIQECSTSCQGCSYTVGTCWAGFLLSHDCCDHESGRRGWKRCPVETWVGGGTQLAISLTCCCVSSHMVVGGVGKEAVIERVGWVKLMLLLCLVRPMLVPTEELKVHNAAPLHLHNDLLFTFPGECLLNLASGKLPASLFVDCV